jgi:hypothetical protein
MVQLPAHRPIDGHQYREDCLVRRAEGEAELDEPDDRIDRTVEAIVRYARTHHGHMRFIARERYGGVRAVREAIAAELEWFTDKVATALAARPEYRDWNPGDMSMSPGSMSITW